MKKYSADYFEKKYRILFKKLSLKVGFLDAVKETRKELALPENGLGNETDLAIFFIDKMKGEEQRLLAFFAFADDYHRKNNLKVGEEDKEKMMQAFAKENRDEQGIKMVFWLGQRISDHNHMLTQDFMFRKNKYLSKLFPKTMRLIRKFWGLDLLDEHIMGHFVEKYLFLGDYGINKYIQQKVVCTNCRYIGVNHFSAMRTNMEGQDEGPYSKKYIFNKETVKRLSLEFNSVFLIIKPYANKEEVLQYVEDNWNDLKEHIIEKNTFYKQYDVHPGKIKTSNFEKNKLVYELYRLSKKELLKTYRGDQDFSLGGIYKETIIAAILSEEHQIDMSPDAIKKTATRYAKDTQAKRQPRDIRDI